MQLTFKLLTEAAELRQGVSLLLQLRPQLSADTLLEQVMRQQGQGYQLLGAFLADRCVGIAGYVIGEKLAWGKYLYIDDLVTDAAVRSQGVGEGLFRECLQRAKQAGCQSLHLDSGVQRFDAHRFYLRHKMRINSHHFALECSVPCD